ncbi:hypothetical protein GA0115260_1034421 [Streptomyces sp. MnatMP-M27]|nr:hypothetical protein GA0115260_1034421 [Streptomyces sp. MnatMP-M27]
MELARQALLVTRPAVSEIAAHRVGPVEHLIRGGLPSNVQLHRHATI